MAEKLKGLLPYLSHSSLKQLPALLKNFPNKIYSVEIKIKTQTKDVGNESSVAGNSLKATGISVESPTSSSVSSLPPPAATTTTAPSPLTAAKSLSATTLEKSLPVPDLGKFNNAVNSSLTATPEAAAVKRKLICDLKKTQQSEIIDRTNLLMALLTKYSSTMKSSSIQQLMALNANLKEINNHIEAHPEANNMLIRDNILSKLLQIRDYSQKMIDRKPELSPEEMLNSPANGKAFTYLNENSRQALSRLGYADPPKGRGIKILSIDGGGTRGVIVIEILRQIERNVGKPIHEIFDVICGVSTGAILSMLLGALRMPIDECEAHYRQVSSHLFDTDIVRGTGRLLWSHAYYDTPKFEKILKNIYGDNVLIDTRKNAACPHILAISAIVNMPTLQPYIFRNFEHHPSSRPLSHFCGGSQHQIWEAVRASAAAPGYFEEFTLGKHVHQDGGILLNNPTAVAVHEAKLLWPNEQIQCVLSLGSGRYQPAVAINDSENESPATLSSLKHKLLRLIDSATDTEMVHRLMMDLLPHNSYFRINPVLRNQAGIDENRPEMLEAMKMDAEMYLRRNDYKFRQAVEQLSIPRSLTQTVLDSIKLKSKHYL